MKGALQVKKKCTLEGHRDSVYDLCAGSGSELYSAGGDGMLVGWNPLESTDGVLIAKLDNSIYAITHSIATGEIVVAHNYDGVHLIDPINKKERSIALTDAAIYALEVVGMHLFVGDAKGIVTKIQLDSLVVLNQWQVSHENIRVIRSLSSGKLAVGCSDNRLLILDPDSGDILSENTEHTNSIFGIQEVNQKVYTAARDARFRKFPLDAVEKNEGEIIGHMYAINDIVYNSQLELLVTCSMDKTIKLWDEPSGQLLKVLDKTRFASHGTSINRLLWVNNELVSCSDDRTISVWEIDRY